MDLDTAMFVVACCTLFNSTVLSILTIAVALIDKSK